MITDAQTDRLYLPDQLRMQYPEFYNSLAALVRSEGIEVQELGGTGEIWARDYMPVQVRPDHFVQFTYAPAYLAFKKYKNARVAPEQLWASAAVTPARSAIILEGGNIVRGGRLAICTTSLLDANPGVNDAELLDELRELLNVDRVLVLPRQPGDFTGHADGIVRFLHEGTVLINAPTADDNPTFLRNLRLSLHNAGLRWIEIPCAWSKLRQKQTGAAGIYLNYLQLHGLIVLPAFGIPEDEHVLRQFEALFPKSRIRPIDCTEIAKGGGLLNCITWTIMTGQSGRTM